MALRLLSYAPAGAGSLQLGHAAEDAAILLKEVFRSAFLCDLAVCKHDDVIRCLHGAHPVSDDQHGLALQQTGQSALHPGLVFHVQRGRGFVQHHNGRVLQDGPGQRHALLLAAGTKKMNAPSVKVRFTAWGTLQTSAW